MFRIVHFFGKKDNVDVWTFLFKIGDSRYVCVGIVALEKKDEMFIANFRYAEFCEKAWGSLNNADPNELNIVYLKICADWDDELSVCFSENKLHLPELSV